MNNKLNDLVFALRQASMKFPPDYPYSPPNLKFLSKVWHPNVYEVRIVLEAPKNDSEGL